MILPYTPTAHHTPSLMELTEKKRRMELSAEECIEMFGERDAVLMNFVPMMLTMLAFEQLTAYIDYCRDYRLSDYKAHNRQLRVCIKEYDRGLRLGCGPSWPIYEKYCRRLREYVDVDLFKCWCTFTNEVSHQYRGMEHRDIPARVTLARMLMAYVEQFGDKMDAMVGKATNSNFHTPQTPYCVAISVLCIDIADKFDHKMKVTDVMTRCVRVLANRCRELVGIILDEEGCPK